MDYLYTLCFIKRDDEILMLNRNKAPWLGIWNGVGGKRHRNESPLECILREIKEETHINPNDYHVVDKGIVTWNGDFKASSSGLHLFLMEVSKNFQYQTPIETDEGILSWKKINWINDIDNLGVSYNIPYFINNLVNDKNRFHYHCIFKGNELLSVEVNAL
ncbi:NUDIX hydrolase [Acholeplasma granularum]|uniref:NUDIX hydrolase n=1 Tax=Acholeplasma granularum TaxID=264635 RepID=UPI0004B34CAD|nr:8-oxo-dGTP diphosphatase [Acholeplasma granularum]